MALVTDSGPISGYKHRQQNNDGRSGGFGCSSVCAGYQDERLDRLATFGKLLPVIETKVLSKCQPWDESTFNADNFAVRHMQQQSP
eukprot:112282-Amphidinium_carterae.1